MRKQFLVLLFAFTSFAAIAQKQHFIYIQSETEQPFFVKMDERVYSSSSSGYLILPKLSDQHYQLTVGFPQNKWADQLFSINLAGRDHGYLLKNYGETGWGLFDLQNLSVKMSSSPVSSLKNTSHESQSNTSVSEFTEILAKAADDPSLREKPVRPKEKPAPVIVKEVTTPVTVEAKPVTEQPAAKKSEGVVMVKSDEPEKEKAVVAKKEEVVVGGGDEKKNATVPVQKDEKATVITPLPEVKKEEKKEEKQPEEQVLQQRSDIKPVMKEEAKHVPLEEEYRRSAVTKKNESSTSEGLGIVFVDMHSNGEKDTISLLIPDQKKLVVQSPVEVKEEKDTRKFIEIGAGDEKEKKAVAETKPVVANACSAIATESDFLKFRKRLASAHGDQEMLSEAAKYFRAKCYTTAQVKHLGAMFLNDGAKYKFYDAAYASVTDLAKYPSLESELTDPYYINRFRAILK